MVIWIILGILVLGVVLFCLWQNNAISMSEFSMESAVLPKELDGCRIVHLSDLHNKGFGSEQKRLIAVLEKMQPDLILITGDLIDKRRSNESHCTHAISLLRQAAELAPVYFVAGNHEWQSGFYDTLRPRMETLGVTILENKTVTLEHGGSRIGLIGLSDRAYLPDQPKEGRWGIPGKSKDPIVTQHIELLREQLGQLCKQQEGAFQILLAHRPDLAEIYAEAEVDLAFCGHAHGGQIRLPGIGGLLAPDQGWKPIYTEGAHVVEEMVMFISRGLGNSSFPLRIFNRPEVLVVNLHSEDETDTEGVANELNEESGLDKSESVLADESHEEVGSANPESEINVASEGMPTGRKERVIDDSNEDEEPDEDEDEDEDSSETEDNQAG